MPPGFEFSFPRYLAAKKTVDDRALNGHVWQTLVAALPPGPLDVLEVGAGIGTMVERLMARGVLPPGSRYTAIDGDAKAIATARQRLQTPASLALALEAVPLAAFAERERGRRQWDLLLANAFLDLVYLERALEQLFSLLRPEGLFYFTINFDGATIFEPLLDPALDAQIERLYHETMEARRESDRPTGGSHAGRKLFQALRAAGAELLAAGSSDWVVFPRADGYEADEATFLHAIVHMVAQALDGHPALDAGQFSDWIAARHAQIEARELVYIAHQLDFVGRRPSSRDPSIGR